ncbi:MAG: hypothetical protein K0R40_1310 [Burkholderiales bacterium]|jgi:hypothetical protein|nr:hypothetical protein [Burkholderiales bacterium]
MPPYRLTAEVAGRAAREALAAGEGTVCAVFKRSFYLQLPGNRYACVGDLSLGRGPLNALVRDFAQVDLGTRVAVTTLETWQPRPMNGAARPNLAALHACLDGHVPQEGLGGTILGMHNGLSVHAQPALEALDRWLAGNTLASEVAQLIGLGPGLTPSGDDYLGGVLIGLRWLGRAQQADSLWRLLGPRLAGATGAISAAHLAAAAQGEAHEALHQVLDDLSAWQAPDLMPGLARLDAVGHTSGWDALAGVVAVARTVQ